MKQIPNNMKAKVVAAKLRTRLAILNGEQEAQGYQYRYEFADLCGQDFYEAMDGVYNIDPDEIWNATKRFCKIYETIEKEFTR